ncbi:hypothetical protein [Erythrobacter sp. SG61-1L]|uniref:hypothetical protein n=1 Tax=Erythrobacter sp. SG61-1L TaxID=1603897 RepID=UPI00138F7E40|nr:hypothetical protein [Erythrobacter sp. SG61-1L]
MPLNDLDRAFRVVLAAKQSRREKFFRKKSTAIFLSDKTINRFSVNIILGSKRLIESNLNVSCYICGGGYGCLTFELGSDEPIFNAKSILGLVDQDYSREYLSEIGIFSISFRGVDGDGATSKEELLYSRSSSRRI